MRERAPIPIKYLIPTPMDCCIAAGLKLFAFAINITAGMPYLLLSVYIKA